MKSFLRKMEDAEQNDVTPAPAIAAVGPAPRLVFFAAKTDTTTPAFTCGEFHCAFIDEHISDDAEAGGFAKVLANVEWTEVRQRLSSFKARS